MTIRTIILLLTCPLYAFSQDYIGYQRIFNRIDEDILSGKLTAAVHRLDTVYRGYDFIYARHCIKALQISCALNDSLRADKWLLKSIRQGVPLWMIRTNEKTKKALSYKTAQQTILTYDSLYAVYKASLNLPLARKIDSLITGDQKVTDKINEGFVLSKLLTYPKWKKNNKAEFWIIKEIMDTCGFPGERLIGLPPQLEDSAISCRDFVFYGPGSVLDHRAYTMLIHYFSNPRKDINELLLRDVRNGYLSPYQYGAINDFMARFGKGKPRQYLYFNVWHEDNDLNNKDDIDQRRYSIGLNSLGEQERNRLLGRERRKNHKANSEIMLE